MGKICFLDKVESTVSRMLTVLRPNLDYDLTMCMGRHTRKPTTVRRIGLGCRADISLVETIRRISLPTLGHCGTQSSRRARSLPTGTSGRPHQSRRRPSSLAEHFAHVLHTTVAFASSFSYRWPFVTPQRFALCFDVFGGFLSSHIGHIALSPRPGMFQKLLSQWNAGVSW